MSQSVIRIVPQADRDSSEWWEFVRDHRLHWQRCAGCGQYRWPSRAICSTCRAMDWHWEAASELATVASWITNHKPVPWFVAPNHTVIVRPVLADQTDTRTFFVPGLWEGPCQPEIGMLVRLVYDDFVNPDGTAFTLLGWTPASSDGVA
jgi:uncharacterized OB-fold protein